MKRKSLEGWLSRLIPLDLTFELTQDDVDSALLKHRSLPLLFGKMSAESILDDLRTRGLQAHIEARGYRDLQVELDQLPLGQEGLEITSSHPRSAVRVSLLELRAFWGTLKLPEGSAPAECRALVWDWLELKDPMGTFAPSRPPLPGQTAPGLSMFRRLVEMMRDYVSRTDAQALVTIPQYFHNAVLYQKDPGLRYRFLDALRQGQVVAQMRDLLDHGGTLHSAAWAFAENRVEVLAPEPGASWKGFAWTPSELVLALTPEVSQALESGAALTEYGEAHRFRVSQQAHPDIEGSFHLAG